MDQCVFDGADDEGATAAFGGLVQLEIVPNLFVDGLGSGVDNGSGVIWDDWVDDRPCRRGEHLVMLLFKHIFIG